MWGFTEKVKAKLPKEVALNIHLVKNEIIEQELKQWWVAEQLGVDKKTVSRWLNGKVKFVQRENAKKVAHLLGLEVESLCLAESEKNYATNEDQKKAAELLASSQLIDKLGPIGEWDVVESLLKATLVPNLPKYVLGELYNQMSITLWRQGKMNAAQTFAQKAFTIGEELEDKSILATSTLSQANLLSWQGKIDEAVARYKKVMAWERFIPAKELGSALSNLGATLWEAGEFEEAWLYQEKAYKVFLQENKKMNMSIASIQMAFIAWEKGEYQKAEVLALRSMEEAKEADYLRGQSMGALVLAELVARKGEKDVSLGYLESGLDSFAQQEIEEGFNFEWAGRTKLILGEEKAAEEYFVRGIALCENFPLYRASLYVELSRLLEQRGDAQYAEEYLSKAREIYLAAGIEKRASRLK